MKLETFKGESYYKFDKSKILKEKKLMDTKVTCTALHALMQISQTKHL